LGMRVLADDGVALDQMYAHGGMFRTSSVAQRFLAGALRVPVAVGNTASEGGAGAIAVLASYLSVADTMGLSGYLNDVFRSADIRVVDPSPADAAGFAAYLHRYRAGLPIEAAAVLALRS